MYSTPRFVERGPTAVAAVSSLHNASLKSLSSQIHLLPDQRLLLVFLAFFPHSLCPVPPFLFTHDQFPDLMHLSTLQTSYQSVEAGTSSWGVYPAGTAAKGPNLSMDGLSRSGKTTLSLLS